MITDSSPLKYILDKKNNIIDSTSQRYCAQLSRFDFDIVHRSGKKNQVADILSRKEQKHSRDATSYKDWASMKLIGFCLT